MDFLNNGLLQFCTRYPKSSWLILVPKLAWARWINRSNFLHDECCRQLGLGNSRKPSVLVSILLLG